MNINITTNLREFTFNTDNMKSQNRGGNGFNILGIAKKQLRKGETLVRIEEA